MLTTAPAMHDFQWQESERAITIRCRLPLRRRWFLAALLLPPLFWVGVLLLRVLWPWWSALRAGGIPWRDIWPSLQNLLFAEPLVSLVLAYTLLGAFNLVRLIRQAALFTPETTLSFDKQARMLTIRQEAPARLSNSITVPFEAVQGVSAERWIRKGLYSEYANQPDRWFLEVRCRDGRRFRTPATEHSRVLESCAHRIRNGALTPKTIGASHPPQGYLSGVGSLWNVVVLSSIFCCMVLGLVWSDQLLHQNSALAMARLQQKSSSGKQSVQLRYTFALPGGREIHAIKSVDSKLAARWKEGDWLAVRYDRNEPEDSVFVDVRQGTVAVALGISPILLLFLIGDLGDQLAAASPGKRWGLWPRDGWC